MVIFFLLNILLGYCKSINNAMVIKEKMSKIQRLFVLQIASFSSEFFGTFFVGTIFIISITSSNVITESSVMLAKYLLFLQLHIAGF